MADTLTRSTDTFNRMGSFTVPAAEGAGACGGGRYRRYGILSEKVKGRNQQDHQSSDTKESSQVHSAPLSNLKVLCIVRA